MLSTTVRPSLCEALYPHMRFSYHAVAANERADTFVREITQLPSIFLCKSQCSTFDIVVPLPQCNTFVARSASLSCTQYPSHRPRRVRDYPSFPSSSYLHHSVIIFLDSERRMLVPRHTQSFQSHVWFPSALEIFRLLLSLYCRANRRPFLIWPIPPHRCKIEPCLCCPYYAIITRGIKSGT